MPPTSHRSPEHAAATVTAQLPHGQAGTAGTKPCSLQSPPHSCRQRFWGETAVAEATINSTFCLLFLIIKFCILLVMFPSKQALYTWCILHVTYYVLDSCFSTPFLLQLYPTATRANQGLLLLHRAPSPHTTSYCLPQSLFPLLVPWFKNSVVT